MKILFKIVTFAAILQLTTACQQFLNNTTPARVLPPIDSLENAPKMNIKNFLNGDLEGFAIVQDAKGNIEKTFTTKVSGKWEDVRGTVQFNFAFNGGKKDSHTWLITLGEEGTYTVIGHDFSDPAAQGRHLNNVSQVVYTLMVPYKEKKQKIDFEDSFYLVDSSSAILVSVMRQGDEIIGKTIVALKKSN